MSAAPSFAPAVTRLARSAKAGGKARVFVSYSRAEMEFVDRLQTALMERGVSVTVDRQEIEKGEEWWTRIKQLITEADTIVFALSPASVNSPVCKDEVAFAETLNKRFVPIVVRDLDGYTVPAALACLNYVFFVPSAAAGANGNFDAAISELVKALETDITWMSDVIAHETDLTP